MNSFKLSEVYFEKIMPVTDSDHIRISFTRIIDTDFIKKYNNDSYLRQKYSEENWAGAYHIMDLQEYTKPEQLKSLILPLLERNKKWAILHSRSKNVDERIMSEVILYSNPLVKIRFPFREKRMKKEYELTYLTKLNLDIAINYLLNDNPFFDD